MPSPFPGMDPYLEAQGLWESFHAELIACCSELLNQQLPDNYVAKIETRVTYLSVEDRDTQLVPDVLIGQERDGRKSSGPPLSHDAGVATIEPITIPFAHGEVEIRDRWVEIFSLPEMELVTIVEILSPTNKAGSSRREYLAKLAALIDRPVNFVEIDLLLAGRRMPMAKPLPPGDYFAVVGRSSGTPNASVYAWTIKHALPHIPVPLREPDPDVMLNLREAIDLTYDRGRYARIMRYGRPMQASIPLTVADREWAESIGR